MRGIHVTPYAKLVNCVVGKIFDVCVDLRKNSPTYLKYTSAILDGTKQLYIPANCGHGFMALEDYNVVVYLQEGTYDPEVDKSLFWADKTIGVKWPDEEKKIISDKDLKAPTLERFWDS